MIRPEAGCPVVGKEGDAASLTATPPRRGPWTTTCPLLAGREDALAIVRASAEQAWTGGAVLAIEGDAGMGKSRMLEIVRRIAVEAGARTLVGRCPVVSAHAYAPFAEALAAHVRGFIPDEVDTLFAGAAARARTLVPFLAGDDDARAAQRPDQVHAAFLEVLARVRRDRSLLVAIEDLHWADDDTAMLFARIAREATALGVWLVGTWRSSDVVEGSMLETVLRDVTRERSAAGIRLDPLHAGDVSVMLDAMFGAGTVPAGAVRTLHARASGNPYVVEELSRDLLDRGVLDATTGRWEGSDLPALPLPRSVREALAGRLRRLDGEDARRVRVASLHGDAVDVPLVARACAATENAVRVTMQTALRHQLLRETRDGIVHAYAFRHDLTREAIAADIPAAARQEMHAALAAALLARAAAGQWQAVGEAAHHLALAGDVEAAARTALLAARGQRAHAGFAEADRQYRLAAELCPPHRRAAVLAEDAGMVMRWDPERAAALARDALRLARAHGDTAARAAAQRVLGWTGKARGDDRAVTMFEEAADLATSVDEVFALELVADLASVRTHDLGDDEAARQAAGRAMELATALGDDRSMARALVLRADLAADDAGAAALFDEARRRAGRVGQPEIELEVLFRGAHDALLRTGDVRRAVHWCDAYHELEAEAQLDHDRSHYAVRALAKLWAGRVDDALAELGDPHAPYPVLPTAARLERFVEVAILRGDVDGAGAFSAAAEALVRRQSLPGWLAPALVNRARALAMTNPRAALGPLEEALPLVLRPGSRRTHWIVTHHLAQTLQGLGDVAGMRALVDRLDGVVGAQDERGLAAASSAFVRGLAALLDGDVTTARTALVDAAERYARMPHVIREVDARLALADAEWQAGDRAASRAAAMRAQEIASTLGSAPLADRALHALRRLHRTGRHVALVQGGPPALTARERDVVRLTAMGMTARAVGERLFLSPRTVEAYVDAAKVKLGARSKAELIRIALEARL